MNDFSEIEADLRRLRPSGIRPELLAQMEVAMKEGATPTAVVVKRRTVKWTWLPLGLGFAAAATFFLLARPTIDHAPRPAKTIAAASSPTTTTAPARNSALIPAGVTQVVYHTSDEGLELPRGSTMPVRRLRSRKRETLHFQNPQTGASLRVTYPADEIRLIPVDGQ